MVHVSAAATATGNRAIPVASAVHTEVRVTPSIRICGYAGISCSPSGRSTGYRGCSLRAALSPQKLAATQAGSANEALLRITYPEYTCRSTVANKAANHGSHLHTSDGTESVQGTERCGSGQLESENDQLEPSSVSQPSRPSQRPPITTISITLASVIACAILVIPLVAAASAHAASGIERVSFTFLQGVRDFLGGNSGTLISPSDQWGVWTVLLGAAAGGFWSEGTSWGRALSGPLVSTLLCLLASNLCILPTNAAPYAAVNRFLLPLAVPLLLFGADLRRVVRDTGRLLLAFLVGAAGTVVGTFAAFYAVPLTSLGADGWKIAAALMSRHIGGAVNYVAVTDALAASPSVVTAALAADNLLCAVYFTSLFALAANIGPEGKEGEDWGAVEEALLPHSPTLNVLDATSALALSALLCWCGSRMASALHFTGGTIPCITALVLVLATGAPQLVSRYVPVGDRLASILLQVFFATVGATGSVSSVIQSAPSLFLFILIQLAIHVAFTLIIGKILFMSKRDLLIASNANVGGPTTAAGMAAAKGWRSLRVPAILVGILGYAVATFLSIALGHSFLRKMHQPVWFS